MKKHSATLLLLAGAGLSASSSQLCGSLCVTHSVYAVILPIEKTKTPSKYFITPWGVVSPSILGEPDLSGKKLPVDDAGLIQVPLAGPVHVATLTPTQAPPRIAKKFDSRYLRNPKLTLNVIEQPSQILTVEGQVTKAGAYSVDNQTTMLGAIALGQNPTRIAKLDEVAVFPTINNQCKAAPLDLGRIRAGRDEYQVIVGDDVVVVGFSQAKTSYHDLQQAATIFNVFTRV